MGALGLLVGFLLAVYRGRRHGADLLEISTKVSEQVAAKVRGLTAEQQAHVREELAKMTNSFRIVGEIYEQQVRLAQDVAVVQTGLVELRRDFNGLGSKLQNVKERVDRMAGVDP